MDERDGSRRRIEAATLIQTAFRIVCGVAVAVVLVASSGLVWRAYWEYREGFNDAMEAPPVFDNGSWQSTDSAEEWEIPSTDSAAESSAGKTVKPLAAQDDAIREAVMRWLVDCADSNHYGKDVTAYFLSFEGHADPPKEFLKRFEQHQPVILAASKVDPDEDLTVTDPLTGKDGLLLEIDSIKRVSDTEVEVEVEYWRCDIWFGGQNVRCTLRDGRWRAVGEPQW